MFIIFTQKSSTESILGQTELLDSIFNLKYQTKNAFIMVLDNIDFPLIKVGEKITIRKAQSDFNMFLDNIDFPVTKEKIKK